MKSSESIAIPTIVTHTHPFLTKTHTHPSTDPPSHPAAQCQHASAHHQSYLNLCCWQQCTWQQQSVCEQRRPLPSVSCYSPWIGISIICISIYIISARKQGGRAEALRRASGCEAAGCAGRAAGACVRVVCLKQMCVWMCCVVSIL